MKRQLVRSITTAWMTLLAALTVTAQSADTTTTYGMVPIGTVCAFPADGKLPDGWLYCDGQRVSRSEYPRLFAVLGTWYGSETTSDSFDLPDYRGVFLRGADTSITRSSSTNRDVERSQRQRYPAGSRVGNRVGSYQSDAFQGHHHSMYEMQALVARGPMGINQVSQVNESTRTRFDQTVVEPIPDAASGTPRTAPETRTKNVTVHFIIRAR